MKYLRMKRGLRAGHFHMLYAADNCKDYDDYEVSLAYTMSDIVAIFFHNAALITELDCGDDVLIRKVEV